jgi:hypothetical protein
MHFIICVYVVSIVRATNDDSLALYAADKISGRGVEFGKTRFVISATRQNMY